MLALLEQNPAETFLIEGHTDAVGSDLSNLALSDQRAESVAYALTRVYGIPAENLATQGYGERYLKVNTQAAERTQPSRDHPPDHPAGHAGDPDRFELGLKFFRQTTGPMRSPGFFQDQASVSLNCRPDDLALSFFASRNRKTGSHFSGLAMQPSPAGGGWS